MPHLERKDALGRDREIEQEHYYKQYIRIIYVA